MGLFWIIYFVTLGATLIFTTVIVAFFNVDDTPISVAYAVLIDLMGAIPVVNVLVCLVVIIVVLTAVFSMDLVPKENLSGNNEKK